MDEYPTMTAKTATHTMPSLASIYTLVKVLNKPWHGGYNKAAAQLKTYVHTAWSQTLGHTDSYLARLSNPKHSTTIQEHSENMLFVLENLESWPKKLQQERGTAITIHWMYLLHSNEGAFFRGHLEHVAADWMRDTSFESKEDLKNNIGQGREVVKHLDTLLLDGHLRALHKTQPERADAIAHHVYWWLRQFGCTEGQWKKAIFVEDGRLEWVRMCIVKAWVTMDELAKEWGTEAEWAIQPKTAL